MEQDLGLGRLGLHSDLPPRVLHQGGRHGLHSAQEKLLARPVELDRLFHRDRQPGGFYAWNRSKEPESFPDGADIEASAVHDAAQEHAVVDTDVHQVDPGTLQRVHLPGLRLHHLRDHQHQLLRRPAVSVLSEPADICRRWSKPTSMAEKRGSRLAVQLG